MVVGVDADGAKVADFGKLKKGSLEPFLRTPCVGTYILDLHALHEH